MNSPCAEAAPISGTPTRASLCGAWRDLRSRHNVQWSGAQLRWTWIAPTRASSMPESDSAYKRKRVGRPTANDQQPSWTGGRGTRAAARRCGRLAVIFDELVRISQAVAPVYRCQPPYKAIETEAQTPEGEHSRTRANMTTEAAEPRKRRQSRSRVSISGPSRRSPRSTG